MKESGDLLFLHRNLTGFDVDKGMFEELALNVGRQIVPPQEHRRAEVLKDARFLLGERYPLLAASSLYRLARALVLGLVALRLFRFLDVM